MNSIPQSVIWDMRETLSTICLFFVLSLFESVWMKADKLLLFIDRLFGGEARADVYLWHPMGGKMQIWRSSLGKREIDASMWNEVLVLAMFVDSLQNHFFVETSYLTFFQLDL